MGVTPCPTQKKRGPPELCPGTRAGLARPPSLRTWAGRKKGLHPGQSPSCLRMTGLPEAGDTGLGISGAQGGGCGGVTCAALRGHPVQPGVGGGWQHGLALEATGPGSWRPPRDTRASRGHSGLEKAAQGARGPLLWGRGSRQEPVALGVFIAEGAWRCLSRGLVNQSTTLPAQGPCPPPDTRGRGPPAWRPLKDGQLLRGDRQPGRRARCPHTRTAQRIAVGGPRAGKPLRTRSHTCGPHAWPRAARGSVCSPTPEWLRTHLPLPEGSGHPSLDLNFLDPNFRQMGGKKTREADSQS